MKRFLLVLACLVLAPFAAAEEVERAVDRSIAVTFDDLPWQRIGQVPEGELAGRQQQLLAALRAADVPVTGFVNESGLEVDGERDPGRMRLLLAWLEAGLQLGNHTWGHSDLHEVGADAFRADIVRGEQALRPLLAGLGHAPEWFRHPHLHTGRDEEEARAVAAFLAERGYRFVDLGTAVADPAYAEPPAYYGEDGPEWLQRWAAGKRRLPRAYSAGEPMVPAWVRDLAEAP